MYRHPKQHRRGFTLIELLVSIVILAVGLIALSQLYIASLWTYQKARCLSVATQRANHELETVTNLGFPGLGAANTGTAAYPSTDYTALTSPKKGFKFKISDLPDGEGTVEWSYYPVPTTPSKLYKVVINIDWEGSVRAQTRINLTTFIAEGAHR